MTKAVSILAAAALVAGSISAFAQDRSLVIAATTSVEDSGLFAHIIPRFQAAIGITVRVVSRASAVALMTAERGTIDAVIVIDWIVSEEGKRTIAEYRINGEQVFTPAPGPTN